MKVSVVLLMGSFMLLQLAIAASIPSLSRTGFKAPTTSLSPAPTSTGDNFYTMRRYYEKYIQTSLDARGQSTKCTFHNLSIRKSWADMEDEEKRQYLLAAKCIHHSQPSKSLPNNMTGVKLRADDFTGTHILNDDKIHFTGLLFPWHRYFIWAYEQALQECNYDGPLPYWDFTDYAQDPRKDPIFDGSDLSMSGNGRYIPHGPTIVTTNGLIQKAVPGTGGGCVEDGPFANLNIRLGLPFQPTNSTNVPSYFPNMTYTDGIPDSLQWHERCLTRDLNPHYSTLNKVSTVENLLWCSNMTCLEQRIDGWETDDRGAQIIHRAAHLSIGGLQIDTPSSPGDPFFYLIHAQIDRLWAIWQAQDPVNRVYQAGSWKTPFNKPPSPQVTLDDIMEYPLIDGDVGIATLKVRDVGSTIDGFFCYMYQ